MTSRKVIGMAVVIGLVAVFLGWQAKRARSVAESSREALVGRVTATRLDVERLRKRLAGITHECAVLSATLAQEALTSAQVPPKEKSAERKAAMTSDHLAEMVRQLRENQTPKGQTRQLVWHAARIAESHQGFVYSSRLAPATEQRLQEIMLRREEEKMDIMAVARGHGLTLMDSALAKLWTQGETNYQNSLRELLADEDYSKFQEYERTVSIRDLVRNFIGVTTLAGMPISSQQAEQLLQVLADTSGDYRKGGVAYTSSVDWQAGLENARKILLEEQLKWIVNYEPAGGIGGLGWMRFNQSLQQAENADSVAKDSLVHRSSDR